MRTFNLYFITVYAIFLLIGLVLLLAVNKGDILLSINRNHHEMLDTFFYWGDQLGHGAFFFAVIAVLLFVSYGKAFIGVVAISAVGIFVGILKRGVFADIARPKAFFECYDSMNYVDGVKVLTQFSFPSGHTTTAFALFCMLSLMVKRKEWGVLFAILALIGGFSRIYLVQHFFVDVYFGSLLGFAIATCTTFLISRSAWYKNSKWTKLSLLHHVS